MARLRTRYNAERPTPWTVWFNPENPNTIWLIIEMVKYKNLIFYIDLRENPGSSVRWMTQQKFNYEIKRTRAIGYDVDHINNDEFPELDNVPEEVISRIREFEIGSRKE